MMLGIASCLTEEPIDIRDTEAIHVSYPTFFEHLDQLAKKPEDDSSGFFFMCHKILGFDIACLKQKTKRKGNAFSLQKQPE